MELGFGSCATTPAIMLACQKVRQQGCHTYKKSFQGEYCGQGRVNTCGWTMGARKAGGANDQTSDRVCDAGDVCDEPDSGALAHSYFFGWRRRGRRWRRRYFRYGPGPFLSAFA